MVNILEQGSAVVLIFSYSRDNPSMDMYFFQGSFIVGDTSPMVVKRLDLEIMPNPRQREEQRSTITTTTEMTGDLLQQQRSTTTTTTANLIGEITRDEPDSGNEEIGKGEFGVGGVFFTASHQSEIGGDGKRERRTMGLSFEGGSVEGLED
ncbi:hypothetical protein CsSME_00039035 [Camellia sinensis var. sinensis]